MKSPDRESITNLEELPNIGKAIARLLVSVGINHPQDLIDRDPFELYEQLCQLRGRRQDPCVLDTFMSAIHFMEGGDALPWWIFTADRKRIIHKRQIDGKS